MKVRKYLAAGVLASSLTVASVGSALAAERPVDSHRPINAKMREGVREHRLPGKIRAMGTIKDVDPANQTLSVEGRWGGTHVVRYTDETKFTIGKEVVSPEQLTVGSRIKVKARFDKDLKAPLAQVVHMFPPKE